jgi:hypothetical protein
LISANCKKGGGNLDSNILIEEMLERACPSIKYRLLTQVLGYSKVDQGVKRLQEQILQDPDVQEVNSWQEKDGWLGWNFHGTKSMETGVRLLCEKGLDHDCSILVQALQSLDLHPDRLERGIGKVGKILDENGSGGTSMILATVLAYAGMEDRPIVKTQIRKALSGFRAVLDIEHISDITEAFHDRLVFKPNVRWPSIYHLRLLAYTHGWRTSDKLLLMSKVLRQLERLSPIPPIYVRAGSRWAAPASFAMHDFTPDPEKMNATGWLQWIHRTECLARSGILIYHPETTSVMEYLSNILDTDPVKIKRRFNHYYFTRWGAYTGLRLERDWRSPKRVFYDLAIRWVYINSHTTP